MDPVVTNGISPNRLNNMENGTHVSLDVKGSSDYVGNKCSAISIRNACKSYINGDPVLKNLNMTVPHGTIYGLLGASGCGKTTMLSCIVGIRKLDSGDISVFGNRPGTPESGIPGRLVGYMPQDIALYSQLTIKEMLQYFGRIYGMSQQEIIGRIEFLSNFLDLPPSSRRIDNLSGGQKRRTSLASCLLHEPSLLILDEPTVGVDPLLRESIWEYLSELVAKKHTTVVITTHYIEEARQSHTVGLMRNGRLLTEKSPDTLLKEHNTKLLEDIVLKLCKNDTSGFNENYNDKDEVAQTLAENSFYSRKKLLMITKGKSKQIDHNGVVGLKFKQTCTDENQNSRPENVLPNQRKQHEEPESFKHLTTKNIRNRVSRIRALAIRNILILLRSPIFMLAIFFMPSFQVIMVNLTVGPEPKNMNLGIVDGETMFDLDVCKTQSKGCLLDNLSCRYLNTLPGDVINPISKNSVEEALADVRAGKLWGYMSFPTNYSRHLTERILSGNFAENETLDGSTVSLQLDMSHYFAGVLLTKTIYESFQMYAQNLLKDCAEDGQKAELAIKFRQPIYGTFDVTFQEYISPGVLMMILFFIPFLSSSVAIITDRKQGTLDRSMVAGVTTMDITGAFFLTEGFLILVQALISYCIVIFVFQMEIRGSTIAFLLLIIMTGISGLSFGFLIGQICNEEVEALIVGIGFYLPNLILSGIIWPLEAVPKGFRFISYCLPCTWPITAVRSIISRGWSVTHPYVWPGYAVVLTWIVLAWSLAIIVRRARFH